MVPKEWGALAIENEIGKFTEILHLGTIGKYLRGITGCEILHRSTNRLQGNIHRSGEWFRIQDQYQKVSNEIRCLEWFG